MALFRDIHELIIQNLTSRSDRKWQEEVFMREELYKTAFDIENLILNVYSKEYVTLLKKYLQTMLRYSCLNFFRFYASEQSRDLRSLLQSKFKKMLKNRKVSWGFEENFRKFDFSLPFIQFEIENFSENFGDFELAQSFRKNAHAYLKVGFEKINQKNGTSGKYKALIKAQIKGLYTKLKKAFIWKDCKKIKNIGTYRIYITSMIKDIILFYSGPDSGSRPSIGEQRAKPAQSIVEKCAFSDLVVEMVTESLKKKKSIPKIFHKSVVNLLIMGHLFQFEMKILKNLIQIMAIHEQCIGGLRDALVEHYSQNKRFSFLYQLEMTYTVIDHLLSHFFAIVGVIYDKKISNGLENLLLNLKLIFNQIKSKSSSILIGKQEKKKIFGKLELSVTILDFLLFYTKEGGPNFSALTKLNLKHNMIRVIMKLQEVVQNMNFDWSVIDSPQFQNLNRLCHLKLSVYFYHTKNPKLTRDQFKEISFRFWQRSQGNSYFFRNLIRNEKRFRLKKNHLKVLLSFENQDKFDRKQIMIQFVQEIVNLYRKLPRDNLPGYLLHREHFKTSVKVSVA